MKTFKFFTYILLLNCITINIPFAQKKDDVENNVGKLLYVPFTTKLDHQKILKKVSNSYERKKLSQLMYQEEEAYNSYLYFSIHEVCWEEYYYQIYGPYSSYIARRKSHSRSSSFTHLFDNPAYALIQETGTNMDNDQIRFPQPGCIYPLEKFGKNFACAVEAPRQIKQEALTIRTHESIRKFNMELLKSYEALSVTKLPSIPLKKGKSTEEKIKYAQIHYKEVWFLIRNLPRVLVERYEAIQEAENELEKVFSQVMAYIAINNVSFDKAEDDRVRPILLNKIVNTQEAWKFYRVAHINLLHELLPQKYRKDLWKRFVLMTIARKNFWQQWLNFNQAQNEFNRKQYAEYLEETKKA